MKFPGPTRHSRRLPSAMSMLEVSLIAVTRLTFDECQKSKKPPARRCRGPVAVTCRVPSRRSHWAPPPVATQAPSGLNAPAKILLSCPAYVAIGLPLSMSNTNAGLFVYPLYPQVARSSFELGMNMTVPNPNCWCVRLRRNPPSRPFQSRMTPALSPLAMAPD